MGEEEWGEFEDFNFIKKQKAQKKRDQLKLLRSSIKELENVLKVKDKNYDKYSQLIHNELPLMKYKPTGKVNNNLNRLKHRHYELTSIIKKERKSIKVI